MMYVKLAPLFIFALFIDGIQFFVALAIDAAMAVPGTILGAGAGAIAGRVVCDPLGSTVADACAWGGGVLFGFLGTSINVPLAQIAEPVGIALGFAVGICLSFTLGSILITFLFLAGALDKKAAVLVFLGEALPGFDMLPSWTGLVMRSAYVATKEAEKSKAVQGISTLSQGLILPETLGGESIREGNRAAGLTARAFASRRVGRGADREESEENLPEIDAPSIQPTIQDIRIQKKNRDTIEPTYAEAT